MIADTIKAFTELLKVVFGFLRKDDPVQTSEQLDEDPMDGFAELRKDHPDDPTMCVRIKRKK